MIERPPFFLWFSLAALVATSAYLALDWRYAAPLHESYVSRLARIFEPAPEPTPQQVNCDYEGPCAPVPYCCGITVSGGYPYTITVQRTAAPQEPPTPIPSCHYVLGYDRIQGQRTATLYCNGKRISYKYVWQAGGSAP